MSDLGAPESIWALITSGADGQDKQIIDFVYGTVRMMDTIEDLESSYPDESFGAIRITRGEYMYTHES